MIGLILAAIIAGIGFVFSLLYARHTSREIAKEIVREEFEKMFKD